MSTINREFVEKFSPVWYNDPYYFGRVHVVDIFDRVDKAVRSGYAITDIPMLDGFGKKIDGWFLAQNMREFAFVCRGVGALV